MGAVQFLEWACPFHLHCVGRASIALPEAAASPNLSIFSNDFLPPEPTPSTRHCASLPLAPAVMHLGVPAVGCLVPGVSRPTPYTESFFRLLLKKAVRLVGIQRISRIFGRSSIDHQPFHVVPPLPTPCGRHSTPLPLALVLPAVYCGLVLSGCLPTYLVG
jgi:hypothetical protein